MLAPDTPARRLWAAVEAVHAVVYFAEEPVEVSSRIGLRGWWMGYFAGRLAPLGPIGPAPAAALLYGFEPGKVARALPDAWSFCAPGVVLEARIEAAATVLDRALPEGTDLTELVDLLERAVTGCRYHGRVLAAAWSEVPRPERPTARLWLAATVLREHRGDGHVLAATAAGLSGLDAALTHIATGASSRDLIQISRGWTDEQWQECHDELRMRGLLTDAGQLTLAGLRLREQVESDTDRLAADPLVRLGTADAERAATLAAALGRHLVDQGTVPVPNPMGLPRP